MKNFMDHNFVLDTMESQIIYHDYIRDLNIIDFHNHLDPEEIYKDKKFDNITDLWLGHDHYKWRLMRAFGIEEELITGDGDPFEKFQAYASMIPYAIGNPIFYWTHLELQRYFDIHEPLNGDNARYVYDKCNEMLQGEDFTVRRLLERQKVEAMCTTDDPIDDLRHHKALAEEGYYMDVKPTFRPEKAMSIEKPDFVEYIDKLSDVSGIEIKDFDDLKKALIKRMDYFVEVGCYISDHSLDDEMFSVYDEDEADKIFKKALKGKDLTKEERRLYKGTILVFLGREYADRNWAMQLHIGAIRNNSTRVFEKLGPDSGIDSMDDFKFAHQISGLLDELDKTDQLPRTILYNLNSQDNNTLVTMMGNFQSGGQKGKMQYGSAWWFLDHHEGMERQMKDLAANGLLSNFIGMVTDSRSFLSFPRHEYFRRILASVMGSWVNQGLYPRDMEFVGKMAQDISYNNAKEYFDL